MGYCTAVRISGQIWIADTTRCRRSCHHWPSIRAVAAAYKANYARYSPPGGEYLIDHAGFIYLMGRAGEYLGFFPPGTSAERLAKVIGRHLADH